MMVCMSDRRTLKSVASSRLSVLRCSIQGGSIWQLNLSLAEDTFPFPECRSVFEQVSINAV